MDQDTKLDLILSKVSSMETKMALIEERDQTLNAKVNNHEERHEKTEADIVVFKTQRSNIVSVFKVVVWVVGVLTGGTAFLMLLFNFFAK